MSVRAQQYPALDVAPQVVPSGANDVAVLVAVEDYLFVPDVAGARQNLLEWEVFLREGLRVPTVTTLVNEQATREEILAAAESAASLAGPESTVWFVFIGHGAPVDEGVDGMLVGVDAQQTARSLGARGVSRAELLQRLETGPQRQTVVLLDACFSGRVSDGAALAPGLQPMVPVRDELTVAENTVVLSAARASEFAGPLPSGDRPAFSYLVLGGMRGWADDGDGQVTAAEAVTFARRELLTVAGRQQTPTVSGRLDAVLTSGVAEARPTAEVAAATAPAAAIDTQVGPARATALHEPSRLFGSVALGAAAEVTYETATPVVDATVGLRLTDPARPTRVAVLAGVTYANTTNVRAHETESLLNDALMQSGVSEFSVAIDVADRTHRLYLGVGPALQIAQGTIRSFADVRAGFVLPLGGECEAWGFDDAGRATSCQERAASASPALGARLGVGYRRLEIAAHSQFSSHSFELPEASGDGFVMSEYDQTMFVAGLTVGLGF